MHCLLRYSDELLAVRLRLHSPRYYLLRSLLPDMHTGIPFSLLDLLWKHVPQRHDLFCVLLRVRNLLGLAFDLSLVFVGILALWDDVLRSLVSFVCSRGSELVQRLCVELFHELEYLFSLFC